MLPARGPGQTRGFAVLPLLVSLVPFVAASIGVTVLAHDALAPRAEELPGVPRPPSMRLPRDTPPTREMRPPPPKPVKPVFESWETIPS